MSEHKHCGECKGCYGYHYPSCSKHSEDIECEFSVQHLQDDDYAQDLIAEIEANRATIATLTQERDAARGLLDALHTEADNAMREIDAVRIGSGTVACRLANEMRYGFISLSKKIRKAKAEEAHDERI